MLDNRCFDDRSNGFRSGSGLFLAAGGQREGNYGSSCNISKITHGNVTSKGFKGCGICFNGENPR